MQTNKWELLAPAGSMEALRAALANGADAAYLGAAAFGARANAGFDPDALKEALRLAHLHRRKIYVTVNILIKEKELPSLRSTLRFLSDAGADAVLVQDLGVLKICREEFPNLPVHASTQMALHNASGAALAKALGARRAVMARECGLIELKKAADTGIEIEAFCHGALCVSCSGQCLFSSMIGGRSGNRGRCAQPCRLPYVYEGKGGAWLSPRDLCARDKLRQLADAGVYSFKIEGRLKRPEYVAVVTRSYRNALDQLAEGRFSPADRQEKEALTQIFSRGGFTLGYPGAERDAAIIDPTRVTPAGMEIGTVKRVYRKGGALLCDALLIRPLHDGDGLEIENQPLRYAGPEVSPGAVATLRLRESVRPGQTVRRTEDESQLSAARATYEGEALNVALPIPFDAEFIAFPGREIALTVTDGESRATATGEICQIAQSKPLDEAAVRRALEKTGGTPFALNNLTIKTSGAFVPASAMNALRRQALLQLADKRIFAHPREQMAPAKFRHTEKQIFTPRLIVKTDDLSDSLSLLSAGADEILYQPRDYRRESIERDLARFPEKARLCLPPQCGEDTLGMIRALTQAHHIPVCMTSPGQMGAFHGMAGEGIPVMNGETIRLLASMGVNSAVLSREMAGREIADLPQGILEMILPVYGRARLMLLNHCPMRTQLGLKTGREKCDLCEKGHGAAGTSLTDRMGAKYPLMPLRLPEGCVIELMANQIMNLDGELNGLPQISYLVTFSTENPAQRQEITAHFAQLLRGENPPPLPGKFTPGRFREGIL